MALHYSNPHIRSWDVCYFQSPVLACWSHLHQYIRFCCQTTTKHAVIRLTWLWEMKTFQMTAHWLFLPQLRCIASCNISQYPFTFCNVMAALHHSCVVWQTPAFPTSCLHWIWELGEKLRFLQLHVTTSCGFQSLPVTPHCFLLLHSQLYLWEHLCINFLLDYRSHAKDNLAWCGFKAGVSLWCRSPLSALICSALYSPMPDGRLKSIILPTEMCFPEHYIKPQSSVQGVWVGEQSRLLDGTVSPP